MEKYLYHLYDKLASRHWWFLGRRKIILDLIDKFLPKKVDLKILDAGCGTGDFLPFLKKYGQVWGIDNSKEAIELCKNKGSLVIQQSLLNIHFPKNNFDLIMALDVIEHINDELAVIRELKRVAKNDGLIVITVPAYQFIWSGHDDACDHKKRYISAHLKKIGQLAGLKLIKISYFNTFLSPLIILFRLVKKLLKIEGGDLKETKPFLNFIFKKIFSAESIFLKYINFPFGVSILAIFKNNALKKNQ